MGQAIHSNLRIADAQSAYVITLPTQLRQDAQALKLRFGFKTILDGSPEVSPGLCRLWYRAAAREQVAVKESSKGHVMTDFHPNALCFGDEFPAGGSPCLVHVEAQGFTIAFTVDGGQEQAEVVPFSRVTVSAGGLDHDQLVLQWAGPAGQRTLYLKNPEIIHAFRQAAPAHLNEPLERAAQQVRQVRKRHRMVWGLVGGSFLALVLGLWFGSDLLVELAVDRIPIEWEQKLGESAYRDFLAQHETVNDGPSVNAITEMAQRLARHVPNNPYTFEVTVVKSDVVNAFALPGGYIVVFTGLMKKATSSEEVAGVLAHELNHVLQRHGLERIVKQLGFVAVVSIVLGNSPGLGGVMKQLGVELMTLKFGRAQETEADLSGLQLLHRAKIDPNGMITFFERLAEKDGSRVEWLSTHPMSSARADRLKAQLAEMPRQDPEPFTFEWMKVQASLG
ncbi:MAG: M48 family metallopeptidase [Nitrospira sp.]|nr:M48 family metallopeptidase [Nitrospira sp.]MDH4244869.1 M48 family metallopeptidase [Nitrospira sp.]MDH4355328.1 M48 family metallopeptidase [Nitrospira sp.]